VAQPVLFTTSPIQQFFWIPSTTVPFETEWLANRLMMKFKTIFALTISLLSAYYFFCWIYAFNTFPDHTSRLARFDELTFGLMTGSWAALTLLALNVTALVLTARSSMHRYLKILTALWLGFISLLLAWSLL